MLRIIQMVDSCLPSNLRKLTSQIPHKIAWALSNQIFAPKLNTFEPHQNQTSPSQSSYITLQNTINQRKQSFAQRKTSMATTFLSPISSHISVTSENREMGILSNGLSHSSFLPGVKPFSSSTSSRQTKPMLNRRLFKSPCAQKSSLEHIPKQFRQDNLKDGCEFFIFFHFIIPYISESSYFFFYLFEGLC